MGVVIPDLWQFGEDAQHLYQLYLCHLLRSGRHERVAVACPRIRQYATRGPGSAAGLFTFCFELDSLCQLRRYQTAWRRLRLREELVTGVCSDIRHRKWLPADGHQMAVDYAPLLFFLGRYREGCRLLETALDFRFKGRNVQSYDILFQVFNEDAEPGHRCRVTLTHFYRKLGRDLRQWHRWPEFVHGLHPRLFAISGMPREDLLFDSAKLGPFYGHLVRQLAERNTSGVGGSLSDLLDSPSRVRGRQAALQRKIESTEENIRPARERTDQRLRELFPELRELLHT